VTIRRSSARSIIHGLVFSLLAVGLAFAGLVRYVSWIDDQFWWSFFVVEIDPPPAIAAWLLVGAGLTAVVALFARSGRIVLAIATVVALSIVGYTAVGPAAFVLPAAVIALAIVARTWPREAFRGPRLRSEMLEPPKKAVRT
jgi:hypothetical protein